MMERHLQAPLMQDLYGDFRITLFWNTDSDSTTQSLPNPTQSLPNPNGKAIVLLQALKSNPKLSQGELARNLGWNINQVKYYLNKLKSGKSPVIRHQGSTRSGFWEILTELPELEKET